MKERKYDAIVHYMMATCGGFLGVYGLIHRLNIFGSAQTMNLIGTIGDIVGRDFDEMALRIGAILIYVASIILATVLEKKTKLHMKYLVIGLEFLVICLLSFFPKNMNPMLAVYPIFFITAFQWCVFKGAKGYVSSTIFSTNNLKQAVTAWIEYYLLDRSQEEERKEKLTKAKFFGGTLAGFHMGVLYGYLISFVFDIESIWFCVPILLIILMLMLIDDGIIRKNFI